MSDDAGKTVKAGVAFTYDFDQYAALFFEDGEDTPSWEMFVAYVQESFIEDIQQMRGVEIARVMDLQVVKEDE